MASPKTNVEFEDLFQPFDDCTCGRKMGDLHCPYCGCATVRGVPSRNNEAVLPNGLTLKNCIYCCRKCGKYFDSVARTDCRAPLSRTVGRPKKQTPTAAKPQPTVETVPDDVQATLDRWGRKNPLLKRIMDEQKRSQ